MRYRDVTGEPDFRTRHKLRREFSIRTAREMRNAEPCGRYDGKWELKVKRRMLRDGRWEERDE